MKVVELVVKYKWKFGISDFVEMLLSTNENCWNVTGEMLKCCRGNVEMPWPKCWFIWSKLLYDFAIRTVRYNYKSCWTCCKVHIKIVEMLHEKCWNALTKMLIYLKWIVIWFCNKNSEIQL